MNKLGIILCSLIIFTSSCYVEDNSPGNTLPLPFEDFSAFFASQSEEQSYDLSTGTTQVILAENDAKIVVPMEAFSANLDLFIQRLDTKSEMVLQGRSSISEDRILDLGSAISINTIANGNQVTPEAPLEITLPYTGDFEANDLSFFYQSNGQWEKDSNVDINLVNNQEKFEFATTANGWLAGAKELTIANTHNLTISGYNFVEVTDFKAFAVLSDHNTVIPLSVDINEVKAFMPEAPAGMEMSIVIMVMSQSDLRLGIETVTVEADSEIEISLIGMPVEEFITKIKTLD